MSEQLIKVEYAKTGQSVCYKCYEKIKKDELRIGKIKKSSQISTGAKTVSWFHGQCFFDENNPKSITEIDNFDNIKWEDQEFIRKKIESGPVPGTSKESQHPKTENNLKKSYVIEYALSNKSICAGCEVYILKNDVRVQVSEKSSYQWYHFECFCKLRCQLDFFEEGTHLRYYKELKKKDRDLVKKALPDIKENQPPKEKKVTAPVKVNTAVNQNLKCSEELRRQNEELFEVIDEVKMMKAKDVTELLTFNSQFTPTDRTELFETLADRLVFGALLPCPICSGQLTFKSGSGYKCFGNISAWTKCVNVELNPKRRKFLIPEVYEDKYYFLLEYIPKVERRILRAIAPTNLPAPAKMPVKKEQKVNGPKVNRGPMPLRGMQFVLVGKTKKTKDTLKSEIFQLGGSCITKVTANVAAVIASEDTVKKAGKAIEDAKKLDIQVISEDFVEEAKVYKTSAVPLIVKKNICSWGSDPTPRVNACIKILTAAVRGRQVEEPATGTIKLQVKGGGVVDSNCRLRHSAHVYQRGDEKFTVTLGITDIQVKKNDFFKMQVLESDTKNSYSSYWFYYTWGRIGETVDRTKNTKTCWFNRDDCITKFKQLFKEKTGNSWDERNNFVKLPGMYYMIDTEEIHDSDVNLESTIPSALQKPVQELVRLIFDVISMKETMKEFELDVNKLPLGALSKNQLQKAYLVLNDLLSIVKSGKKNSVALIDLSNQFYTLVPHSFEVNDPPILNSLKLLKAKCDMVNSLLEMEITYKLLNTQKDANINPLDSHYFQLNTEIRVLDKNSSEFILINSYVNNTHAFSHNSYKLKIHQVFVINRKDEEQRFRPFAKLHNRRLLWHGSRTTNFAGILSQGLRVAPPEAPAHGYMFGKGIYFADMVSKSANYCHTSNQSPTGLLLLCEVALGNMYQKCQAEYIVQLPNHFHSTFGKGRIGPDPRTTFTTSDGVTVRYGRAVYQTIPSEITQLRYNEYIVYNPAQVKAKYLLQVNFEYNL
ncbi:poly [ADP-ribose] polymerase-like [Microplitis mediator]|uniref:poly [ADP-ribose] polymerase-like n=1 Tax=Microplitis mediator TaxID=375433 RepID=UPI00255367ED|nr:poly [ADP-ribose] polymerase-like [Microplitis mediator]